MAGLVVDVAAPPVAVMPVKEGMAKKELAQAAGAAAVMLASLVNVTARGLLAWPLAPTVSALVSVCELPEVAVEKFQITSLGVEARHPGWVLVRPLVVYPVAYVVLVGSCSAVIVTGYGLGFEMVTTTSPVPPGYKRLVAAGDATAVIVRLEMLADCASPDEPEFRPTTQFVVA